MKHRFESILIGLIFAVFFLVLIVVLLQFTGLANVVIAWATLMLAFAVFMFIQHSKEQDKRRRKDEQLKEIMEWVDAVLKHCAIYSQDLEYASRYEFLSAVTELSLKTDYITSIAEGFGNKLSDPLGNVTDIFAQTFDKLGGEETERKKLEGHCVEAKKAISLLRSK